MKRILYICTALLMLLTVVTVSTPAIAAEQTVEPPAGPAGTTFTFHVSGFDHNERVAYWLNTPNSTILAIGDHGMSASSGHITYSWTSRAGIPLGFWQFVAEGVDSHVQKVVTFEITAGGSAPAAGTTNVVPAVGGAGSTFTFYATGFSPGERVGYWLNAPTSTVVKVDDQRHYANSDGQFSVSFVAPSDAAPGAWQLVAQGSQSGVLQVIPFEIH